jgi:CheY-like chemotaxis protein
MKKYKIILVENDEDEQLFMKEGFEASGLFDTLAIAEDGNALFTWLEENRALLPDFILTDLNMPGKNGYDILKDIKAHSAYSQIPVVITSTSTATAVIHKCRDLGAAEYMVKPETFNEYLTFARKFYEIMAEKERGKQEAGV